MAGDAYEGLGARLWRLKPVWVAYAVLIGLVILGYVLPKGGMPYAWWYIFFLIPFSTLYSVPFGLGTGIAAQTLVWYTSDYGHRLVGFCTAIVAVAMAACWGPSIIKNFDPMYLAALIWPVLSSALAMLLSMHFVREREYEEAVMYDDYDEEEDEE